MSKRFLTVFVLMLLLTSLASTALARPTRRPQDATLARDHGPVSRGQTIAPGYIFDDFTTNTVASGAWTHIGSARYRVAHSSLTLWLPTYGDASGGVERPFALGPDRAVFEARVDGLSTYRFNIDFTGPDGEIELEFDQGGVNQYGFLIGSGGTGCQGHGLSFGPPPSLNRWYILRLVVQARPFKATASIYSNAYRLLWRSPVLREPCLPYAGITTVGMNVWTDNANDPLPNYAVDWVSVSNGEPAGVITPTLALSSTAVSATNVSATYSWVASTTTSLGTVAVLIPKGMTGAPVLAGQTGLGAGRLTIHGHIATLWLGKPVSVQAGQPLSLTLGGLTNPNTATRTSGWVHDGDIAGAPIDAGQSTTVSIE